MIDITIPVSPDQEDVIADHVLEGKELGLVPDERAWMLSQARKRHPGCTITAADLDIKNISWTLTLKLPEEH